MCEDSLICVTCKYICVTCDMHHSYLWRLTHKCVWHISHVCVTCIIHMCDPCVWDICDKTHSYICVWLITHVCDMHHSYVWRLTHMCDLWVQMRGIYHSYMWDYVTRLTHICDMYRGSSLFALGAPHLFVYGVALVSWIDWIIGLFCERALKKRQYSAKQTYRLIDPTNRSHPIAWHFHVYRVTRWHIQMKWFEHVTWLVVSVAKYSNAWRDTHELTTSLVRICVTSSNT